MNAQLEVCFLLFFIFQIKHFIADYPLQVSYMIFRKTSDNWDFFLPLLAHASVHASFTLVICLVFAPQFWWLSFLDLAVHFTMDRIKSSPRYLGRFNDLNKPYYWWCLGLDQMVHHMTHYVIVWYIVTRAYAP